MQKALLIALCLTASGCGSMKRETAQWPFKGDLCKEPTSCTLGDALQAYSKASEFCRTVNNYYEKGGFIGDGTSTAVGVVGALSGAVVAPLASGSAAKAWAGLSGATNALQTQMGDFMSSALYLKRQVAVRNAIKTGETKFEAAAGSPDKQVTAAVAMSNQCWSAAADAEEKALKALVAE